MSLGHDRLNRRVLFWTLWGSGVFSILTMAFRTMGLEPGVPEALIVVAFVAGWVACAWMSFHNDRYQFSAV